MELNQVLQHLDYTISKAKELKPEQFDYSDVVMEFDELKKCGTVCCILGHYPNWQIKGFSYFKSIVDFEVDYSETDSIDIKDGLSHYHGISLTLVNFLFFGRGPLFRNLPHYNDLKDYSLSEVIQRFELVRKLLASGAITPMHPF